MSTKRFRIAFSFAGDFKRIAFVSLKSRELDDDGVRDLSGFLITGLAELFNELARELSHAEIAKAPEDQRPRLLLDALRETQTLLVLDNLESLVKKERDILFTFVKKLPPGCKAILTSRGRIGSGAEELILEKLSLDAALATLAELATHNPLLARTSEAERIVLYTQTAGKPLLLRWTAGQLGRGHCLTFTDALHFLRSCPVGNDPLEFIFGDLVEDFRPEETIALSALTYFNLPAKVEHVAEISQCSVEEAGRALRSLSVRSLAVPNDESKTFTLVPLVADFLRKTKPNVVAETGNWLENQAYALIIENGHDRNDRFAVLEASWPMVAAALPRFLAGSNDRLQAVCHAFSRFLDYTGRWDEWLALSQDGEAKSLTAKDFLTAGWRAYAAGWIYYMRGQSNEVLACADRADAHWREAKVGSREQAAAISLRGIGHELAQNYPAALIAYRETVELDRTLGHESKDVAADLNDLATVESISGEFEAAERDFGEALRISKAISFSEGVAVYTGNLAGLALERKHWTGAEAFARESLALAEKLGRQELIATNCQRLAIAFVRQGKKAEGIPYAQRALEIFTRLRSSNVTIARETLRACER